MKWGYQHPQRYPNICKFLQSCLPHAFIRVEIKHFKFYRRQTQLTALHRQQGAFYLVSDWSTHIDAADDAAEPANVTAIENVNMDVEEANVTEEDEFVLMDTFIGLHRTALCRVLPICVINNVKIKNTPFVLVHGIDTTQQVNYKYVNYFCICIFFNYVYHTCSKLKKT